MNETSRPINNPAHEHQESRSDRGEIVSAASAQTGSPSSLFSEWETKRLKDVTKPSAAKVDPAKCPDAPYLSLEHIDPHTTKILGVGSGSDVKSTKAVFNAGDVLYGRLRPYLNKVAMPDFNGIASTDILVFSPAKGLSQRYLLRFLNSPAVVEHAHHHSMGLQMPRIGFDVLGEIDIPFPPISTQEKLADTVEKLNRQVTSARERLTAIQSLANKFRQSVLAAACSGTLTEGWRESHGGLETGEQLVTTMTAATPSKVLRSTPEEPNIDLPSSWTWAAIGNIALIRGGIQKQPHRAPKSNAYPYLRVANVLRDRLDLTELAMFELALGELEAYRLKYGDLLIVEGNGSYNQIGRASIWRNEVPDCVHQNHIIRVRFNGLVPEFVNYYWNSPMGIEQVTSTAVTTSGLYSLSTGKIASLMIPIPPKVEQEEIVRRVKSLLALADSIESRLVEATTMVERTTQAILAKAFRGELLR